MMLALMPAAKIPCVVVLGKIEEKPVIRDGEIAIRTILPLTGTFDHRIVDGKEAVTFLVRVKECIENPARLLVGA